MTNLGNLDRIRHDQGWLAEGDFPSRIWEIWTGSDTIGAGRTLIKIKHDQAWTGSDTIRVSQICDGKWPAEGGFSVTNLGNLDKIRHDQGFPNS